MQPGALLAFALFSREEQSVNNANPDLLSAEGNRFAPPLTHVEDVTTAEGPLAARSKRFWAAMIDMLIAFALLGAVAAATGWKFWAPPAGQSLVVSFGINMGIGFVVYVLVHGWLLHTQGQTVGKRVLGLRVVRSDGSRAGIGRLLFVRYLLNAMFSIVPVIGSFYALADCLLIFRASHKCLHDNLADTIVVKA